MDQLRASGTKV